MQDNDQLFKQLSEEWQQTETNKPDLSFLKRRLMMNRIKMVGLILLDGIITVLMLYLLYKGYKENYSLSMMIWIGFGLIFGLVTTAIGAMQRLSAWRLIDMDTKSWLIYEYNHSKSQLAYSKLMKYGVVVFAFFFHLWLLAGLIFDADFILRMNYKSLVIYLMSVGWFLLFGWIASKIKLKALTTMDYLDRERQGIKDQ